MATMTEEAPVMIQTNIDLITGHVRGDDETAALHRAASSDWADPPSKDHFPIIGIPVQRHTIGGFHPPGAYNVGPFGPPPGQRPPSDQQQYQLFQRPQGGMPQGPPRGGIPRGGGGGGGPLMPGRPPAGQPQGGNRGTDELSENPPTIFTGD
jgi:hypothetical protein